MQLLMHRFHGATQIIAIDNYAPKIPYDNAIALMLVFQNMSLHKESEITQELNDNRELIDCGICYQNLDRKVGFFVVVYF